VYVQDLHLVEDLPGPAPSVAGGMPIRSCRYAGLVRLSRWVDASSPTGRVRDRPLRLAGQGPGIYGVRVMHEALSGKSVRDHWKAMTLRSGSGMFSAPAVDLAMDCVLIEVFANGVASQAARALSLKSTRFGLRPSIPSAGFVSVRRRNDWC
jgi:hypothetical protein